MAPRYAIYAAPPPDDPLWGFGSTAIGYDAARAVDVGFPQGSPFDRPDWCALTEEPRRYGFHGTLKAPFALAGGRSEAELMEAAMLFAERAEAFTIPELAVKALTRFVALVPAAPAPALDQLAGDCVTAFEPFRADLDPADRARRLKAPLTDRQIAQLDTYGYPYVFEDFRYHMTLTGPLPADILTDVTQALADAYRPVAAPFRVDAIVLFVQPERAGRFTILARFPLCG